MDHGMICEYLYPQYLCTLLDGPDNVDMWIVCSDDSCRLLPARIP